MKTAIKLLLPFLVIGHSLAITWTRIGCDAEWVVERITDQGGPMTIDMDQVWANADALSKGARAAIASLDGFEALPSRARKNAAINAELLLPIEVSPHRGVHSSSQANMADIVGVYNDIESALAGSLNVNGAPRGYIFCGGRGFTKDRIPGIEDTQPVWHATVIEGGEAGGQGTTDYIIPRPFRGTQDAPCAEREGGYLGKTMYGQKAGGGPPEDFIGIILCPNQFKVGGLRAFATLDEGYTADTLEYKRPYVANYNSVSGTLVHEMVHVVGHARDPTPPPAGGYHDHASGFRQQYKLARGARTDLFGNPQPASRDQMVFNPDGYRLFAEMCRSPDTTWGFPEKVSTDEA